MYTLKPSNPVVKFAYLFQGRKPPSFTGSRWNGKEYERFTAYKPTSLCPLFWRCVLNLVACVGAAGAVGFLTYLVGRYLLRLTLHDWLMILATVGIVLGAVGAVLLAGYVLARDGLGYGPKVIDAVDSGLGKAANGVTRLAGWACLPLIWDMLKAVRSKMCPIVEFKE